MTGAIVCIALTSLACLLVALNEAERPNRPHRRERVSPSGKTEASA